MSTKSETKKVANAAEVKPANANGLMRKNKQELVDIILRKDKEEIESNVKIETLETRVKSLNSLLDDKNKESREYNRTIDDLNGKLNESESTIIDLQRHYDDAKRDARDYKISTIVFGVVAIIAIGVILFI